MESIEFILSRTSSKKQIGRRRQRDNTKGRNARSNWLIRAQPQNGMICTLSDAFTAFLVLWRRKVILLYYNFLRHIYGRVIQTLWRLFTVLPKVFFLNESPNTNGHFQIDGEIWQILKKKSNLAISDFPWHSCPVSKLIIKYFGLWKYRPLIKKQLHE